MDSIKFNGLGQWDLAKSDGKVNPNSLVGRLQEAKQPNFVYSNGGKAVDTEKYKDHPNFQAYQALVSKHGGGHFGYRPETGEIFARTDHAKDLLSGIQAKVAKPDGQPDLGQYWKQPLNETTKPPVPVAESLNYSQMKDPVVKPTPASAAAARQQRTAAGKAPAAGPTALDAIKQRQQAATAPAATTVPAPVAAKPAPAAPIAPVQWPKIK